MKYLRSLLLLAILPFPLPAQTVELPKEVTAEQGTFAVIRAKTDCATLQWYALDPGLSLIPPELLRDSKAAVVMAGRAGRFRLLAYGAKGDVPSPPALTVVVIGEPGPGPDPGPDPPGPDPVDPLFSKLKAAYLQAPDAARVVKYAEILRTATSVIDSATTAGQLVDSLRATADSLIGAGALVPLRRAIGDHFNSVFPLSNVPLTAELRVLVKKEFLRVATLLGKLK